VPSDLVKRLRQQRESILTQAREVAERASDANRAFDAGEQESYDRHMVELEKLDQRIKQLLETEERANAADATFQRLAGQPGGTAARSEADQRLDTQLRAMALDRDPRPVVLEPGPDRRAYSQPGIERRDLLTTSGTGVPVSVYNQLLMHLVEQSAVLRAGATFIQTPTGEQLKLPKSTAHSTAAIVAEGGTITESDPTVGAASLTGFKYGFFVQASFELLRDASFDVPGYLAAQAAAAIAVAWGAHAITGTGSGQPRGVLLDGSAGVTGPTGTSTTLGAHTTVGMGGDLLADLLASFAEPYVRSRSFGLLTRNASLNIIRKLRDGQSRYVFSLDAPAGSGASGSVFGVPIYVDPNVAAMAANAKSIVGADWSRVYVRQVGPIRFERSDDYAWTSDVATYRCLTTLDSCLVDSTGALKWFANSAT
jgi:HK97 family phage major capsid protein